MANCAVSSWMSDHCGSVGPGTPIATISPWCPTFSSPERASSWMRSTVGSSGVAVLSWGEGAVRDAGAATSSFGSFAWVPSQ